MTTYWMGLLRCDGELEVYDDELIHDLLWRNVNFYGILNGHSVSCIKRIPNKGGVSVSFIISDTKQNSILAMSYLCHETILFRNFSRIELPYRFPRNASTVDNTRIFPSWYIHECIIVKLSDYLENEVFQDYFRGRLQLNDIYQDFGRKFELIKADSELSQSRTKSDEDLFS